MTKVPKPVLFAFICLLFTATSKPPKAPCGNFEATVKRLQKEVLDIALEEKSLICRDRELLLEMNTLMKDMVDRIIRKIDEGETICWNNEIEDVNRRIWDFHYRNMETSCRRKILSHRILTVECKLDTNPKLKERVSMNSIYEAIGEWDSCLDENNRQIELYNDKVDTFKSRVEKLPKK